jgi:hypothetical protein
LQDLVAAVGDEDLIGGDPVQFRECLSQVDRVAIGIAVEGDALDLGNDRADPLRRRRVWGLVRVEPYIHLDLGRVISL